MKKVAIILNMTKQYDRSIVSGIARYIQEGHDWSLHIEDDPALKIPNFDNWHGDGIIADLDDEKVYQKIKDLDIPIVGLGGGYLNTEKNLPYVFTDNKAIANTAAEHLYNRGFRNFAFCNVKATKSNGWAEERANAFAEFAQLKKCPFALFSQKRNYKNRELLIQDLSNWLNTLPKPCGIMAANDSRARLLLEACRKNSIAVPGEIAVVGVDDDPMMCELSTPSLSSVIQGTDQLGYQACCLLSELMSGNKNVENKTVAPQGISVRHSSDIISINDPIITQAVLFIRQNACNGIRVENVARQLKISRSNLEKKFKSILNHSVHDYITTEKIKRAIQLLSETNLPIKDISFTCGFNTVQYMSKTLKDHTGKTPKQIRKSR